MQGILPPGHGGAGGNAGNGGRGGRGADGGISSNVFVSLPPDQEGQLRMLSHPAPGGRGSRGGTGGTGGGGGRPGIPALVPGTPAPGGPRHLDPSPPGATAPTDVTALTDGHGRRRPCS